MTALLGPDNAGDVVLDAINAGEGPLDVCALTMTEKYAWPLARAHHRGRVIRVLLDRRGDPGTAAAASVLHRTGIEVGRTGRPGAACHWKFVIAGDPAVLLIGSGNLSRRDLPTHTRDAGPGPLAGTREWWLRVEGDPALVARARSAFEEVLAMADRTGGALQDTAALGATLSAEATSHAVTEAWATGTPLPQVPPLVREVAAGALELDLGAPAVHARVSDLIGMATRRCLVTVPYLHHGTEVAALLDLLRSAAGRGVEVRVLLGRPPDGVGEIAAGDPALAGLTVRAMDHLRCTVGHAKGVIADDRVLAGSANWSHAGLTANHEAALTVADAGVAAVYADALERDWKTATEIAGPR